jgi:hypothetical protein
VDCPGDRDAEDEWGMKEGAVTVMHKGYVVEVDDAVAQVLELRQGQEITWETFGTIVECHLALYKAYDRSADVHQS